MVWLEAALVVAQLDYQPVHAEEYPEQHADYGKPGRHNKDLHMV